MAFKKKTPEQLGEKLYREAVGLSPDAMNRFITRIMEENKDNPDDLVIRGKIGDHFKQIRKEAAA